MQEARTNTRIDISKPLLKFTDNPKDVWTIDDATKGISIMGGTGSGKTSASGKQIAQSFLKEGWGGLVLCAKTDEAALWEEYCRKTGRLDDLIVIDRGKKIEVDGQMVPIVFNPIDYEMKRSGVGAGETQNITNIFMNIYRMGNRIAGDGEVKEERYWDLALKRCLNRTIELIKLAGEDLSYTNMIKIISTCDGLTHEKVTDTLDLLEKKKGVASLNHKQNYCLKCLTDAYRNIHGWEVEIEPPPEDLNAYMLVEDYFTDVMASMAEKTKSVVTESFMGLAEPFLSGLLHEHFSGATNIFPEWTYEKQKIIVLNLPIKEFLDAGIIAQSVFKLMFQQALERRDTAKYPVPVFLWGDEAQYFINPYDQLFLTTARASRTATVFLSQNISNYLVTMGGSSGAKARVDSLMGNLCTKIFHANSDAETNEYASRLIGKDLDHLPTFNEQQSMFNLGTSQSQGLNSSYLPQVQPKEFTTLKTGGALNNFEVKAVIVVSGREWSDKKNHLKIKFTQHFN